MTEDLRAPWDEGPDDAVPDESWLGMEDDALLAKIESVGTDHRVDERLLEVIQSSRHFFIRQEAAKRVVKRELLFAFEDDRHVGQILVRHLTRQEDLTYLERLMTRCPHGEVRKAAEQQLRRLRRRLDRPGSTSTAVALSEAEEDAKASAQLALRREPPRNIAPEEGVDATLLAWAVHLVAEHAWRHLGTVVTAELLRRAHTNAMIEHPDLAWFGVDTAARVDLDLSRGPRVPEAAVVGVANWVAGFLAEAGRVVSDVREITVQRATRLMQAPLQRIGFYDAYEAARSRLDGTQPIAIGRLDMGVGS
jgi:hypothetical protein